MSPEPALAPPELMIELPEVPVLVLPAALVLGELVPLVLEPPAPAVAFPLPAPELPFVAPLFDAPGEVSLEPLEQLPAAVTVTIAAPARNVARPMKTTERDKRARDLAKFMRELYSVCARGHASTEEATQPCSCTVNLSYASSTTMNANREYPFVLPRFVPVIRT
jgi:hypothetical protein